MRRAWASILSRHTTNQALESRTHGSRDRDTQYTARAITMAAEVAAPSAPKVPTDAKDGASKVKERVKRLEKPDRTILDSQVEKLNAQVERCQARILEIKSIIDAKRNNRRGMSAGPGGAARQALTALRAEFKAALVSTSPAANWRRS